MSSRKNRREKDPNTVHYRPEDYMDEEDLADAAAAKDIRTTEPFAALGSSGHGGHYAGGLASLIRPQGDTMGLKLLRKMGWKDGQGIGPRIRRKARLGVSSGSQDTAAEGIHLFAPDDVNMIVFSRKANRKGLGYEGETRLSQLSGYDNDRPNQHGPGVEVEHNEGDDGQASGPRFALGMSGKGQKQGQRGGFGVGILNDTGSDDDDPYEIGPRISYNRVLGADKAKRKKKQSSSATLSVSANPALSSKPIFVAKPAPTKAFDQARCLDGKPPLKGFNFGQTSKSRPIGPSAGYHPPPVVPEGWTSVRRLADASQKVTYVSTADAAKAAQHDPRSRAAVLGESSLPGKSIFDYMSAASRERLAAASGRTNLPPGRGEIPREHARSAEQKLQDRVRNIPGLAKDTAIAAMSRGAGAGGPYANDEAKRARYRLYLQNAAGFGGPSPVKPSSMSGDDYVKELEEFYGCAQLFKPMTGFMATRFTTASTGPKMAAGSEAGSDSNIQHALRSSRPADPAEEAAKMGMYGRITRLTDEFFPTRLLCKRFNVRPPAHVQSDSEPGASTSSENRDPLYLLPAGADTAHKPSTFGASTNVVGALSGLGAASETPRPAPAASSFEVKADEESRPSDEVFKAIFGDSSDEDE